jgi:5'-methylthioadenosine phosphorylase
VAEPIDLAVLGGSGFYDMPGLEALEEVAVETPFGAPSDSIRVGRLRGRRVAFLARHGRHHSILPSELPQRANFWALKSLGVSRVIAVSAVGSLRQDYRPGDFVVPDQIIDRTRGTRPSTFFGDGLIAHIALADPYCRRLRRAMLEAAGDEGAAAHDGGSLITIEGPAFGTRAESELYRSWGASIVGMTALPEAKLAREAEICYALLAAVTDYDSWNAGQPEVDATTILAVLRQNVATSQAIVARVCERLPVAWDCACNHALDNALITSRDRVPADVLERLRPILARRLGLAR